MTTTDFRPRLSAAQCDLLESLPPAVADRLDVDVLWHRPTAAALRVLSMIEDPRVWQHVGPDRINWGDLDAEMGHLGASTQHVIRVAQCVGDGDLREAACLDLEAYKALIDALIDAMWIASPAVAW